MTKSDGRHRQRVTRALALRTAIRLADAAGIEAVSMRSLATELGVVPMALYKHVANKEDLLSGMVDSLLDELGSRSGLEAESGSGFTSPSDADSELESGPEPEPSSASASASAPGALADPSHATSGTNLPTQQGMDRAGWRHDVRARILDARALILRHPWLRRVIETRTTRTEAVLRHMESLVSAMLAGGLSPELAHHGMHALGHHIWGFNPEAFDGPDALPLPTDLDERTAEVARLTASYPGIAAIAGAATSGDDTRLDSDCDEEFEFTFGLDLLLDGLARRAAADRNERTDEPTIRPSTPRKGRTRLG